MAERKVKVEDGLKRVREIYGGEPTDRVGRYYVYGGWRQSRVKSEFAELSKRIERERGVPLYNPERHQFGLGQRLLIPYKISGTNVVTDGESFHQINNPAIQQMVDDIKRTGIMALDMAHKTLTTRLGRVVTPETVNQYLETVNHTMVGGAVAQEHMHEVNPGLMRDCYIKVFTGDDALADQIDKRFLIDINRNFKPEVAERLKKAVGPGLWQVAHLPTIVVRLADGSATHRWHSMQTAMAFIAAYNLQGEAAVSDFILTAKHARWIYLGTPAWFGRARGQNELGGVPFGYIGDMVQTPMDDLLEYAFQVSPVAQHIEQVYLFNMMSGGIGAVAAVASIYTNDLFDSLLSWCYDYVEKKHGFARSKPSFDTIKDVTTAVCTYARELIDRYPLISDTWWSGLIQTFNISLAVATSVGWATANSQAVALGVAFTHQVLKEIAGRLGWAGHDTQDAVVAAQSGSVQTDEGVPLELHGFNWPIHSYIAAHMHAYTTGAAAAHAARGDAWVLSPYVKVAFSDPSLLFDWHNPRRAIALGATRHFMPGGERDPVLPSH